MSVKTHEFFDLTGRSIIHSKDEAREFILRSPKSQGFIQNTILRKINSLIPLLKMDKQTGTQSLIADRIKSDYAALTQRQAFPLWVLEIGPLILVTACLWFKLVYFSVSLRSVWWAPEEPIGQWIRTHPDIFSATLGSLMVVFGLLPLLPRIWRLVILLLSNFVLTLLVVADTAHVRHYGDVISVINISHAYQLRWILSSIPPLLRPSDAIYFLDIVVGIVLLPLYVRTCRMIPPSNRTYMMRLCVGLIGSGVLLAAPTGRLAWQDKNGVFAHANLQRDVCAAIGLLPYHLVDAVKYFSRKDVDQGERQRVFHFLDDNRNNRKAVSDLFGIARDRNVIVVIAESLHAFTIGLEIHGQPIAPRLSSFARESLYFVNFHDQTHLGTTSDAEFASFQSLHPLPVGVVSSRYSRNHYHGLPAVLKEHRYSTMSAVAEPGGFWNMNRMHPRLGFQQSFFEESYTVVERIGPWLADGEFYRCLNSV